MKSSYSSVLLSIHVLACLRGIAGLPSGIRNDMLQLNQLTQNGATDEKRANLAPFLSGRTKNSVDIKEMMTSDNKEMSICFPYFIAQDVDSFLAQATEMLNKPLNDSQRSWLQLFVHRLDRLSKKLKSLPSEHKTACFQKRQLLLSGANIENGLLDMTPEEVELRFAKQIFDGQEEPQLRRIHPKEYVVGTVLHKSSGPRVKNFDHRPFPGKHVYSLPRPIDESGPRTEILTEDLKRNLPYFSRSTRKTIPWQVLERMNLRNENKNSESVSGPQEEEDLTDVKVQQTLVTTSVSFPDLVQTSEDPLPKASTSINSNLEKIPATSDTSVKDDSNNHDNDEEDDIVLQLHSGISSNKKVVTTLTPKDIEPMGTQDKTEITEPVTIVQQKVPAGKEEGNELLHEPITYELFDESGAYPRQYHTDNNPDFDYEEQGAAAGELKITEDENAPSKPPDMMSISSANKIDDNLHTPIQEVDDAVLQLRALKDPLPTTESTTSKNTDHGPKIPPRIIAGPAGRVHRSHKIHVDDKK